MYVKMHTYAYTYIYIYIYTVGRKNIRTYENLYLLSCKHSPN